MNLNVFFSRRVQFNFYEIKIKCTTTFENLHFSLQMSRELNNFASFKEI